MESIYKQLVKGIQDYFEEAGFERGVVGLSGGIDSSLTLKLAVDALGAENVTGILMPDLGLTKRENIDHASKLAAYFGVETLKVPINGFLSKFDELPWNQVSDDYAKGLRLANINVKARTRMMILYHFANTFSALVLGTSNLSEALLGYGTKYGDVAADLHVLADLYKTEVRDLSRFLNLPPEIINKKPSAELYKDQTDEAELGAEYEELDKILMRREEGVLRLIDSGLDSDLVHEIFNRMKLHKHKCEFPHIIKVNRNV